MVKTDGEKEVPSLQMSIRLTIYPELWYCVRY